MAPPEQITAPAPQKLLKDAALAGAWILDPSRSTVALKSKILGLAPVNGLFRQVTGTGTISPAGEVSGAITVAAASIDTNNTRRDTHLRSADFLRQRELSGHHLHRGGHPAVRSGRHRDRHPQRP
jgi:polyisoprenoid-binding protein YceI